MLATHRKIVIRALSHATCQRLCGDSLLLEASDRKIDKPKVWPHWLSIIERKEQA